MPFLGMQEPRDDRSKEDELSIAGGLMLPNSRRIDQVESHAVLGFKDDDERPAYSTDNHQLQEAEINFKAEATNVRK